MNRVNFPLTTTISVHQTSPPPPTSTFNNVKNVLTVSSGSGCSSVSAMKQQLLSLYSTRHDSSHDNDNDNNASDDRGEGDPSEDDELNYYQEESLASENRSSLEGDEETTHSSVSSSCNSTPSPTQHQHQQQQQQQQQQRLARHHHHNHTHHLVNSYSLSSIKLHQIDEELPHAHPLPVVSSHCPNNSNNTNRSSIGSSSSSSTSSSSSSSSSSASTSNWRYDELNELRHKFMSLLLSPSPSPVVPLPLPLLAAAAAAAATHRRSMLTLVERKQIESFYASYDTSVHVSAAHASLYILANPRLSHADAGEVGGGGGGRRRKEPTTGQLDPDWLQSHIRLVDETMAAASHSNQKSNLNMYTNFHRGVPVWLYNRGARNARRPVAQLKFTLAERGTGFILWQDRIDSASQLTRLHLHMHMHMDPATTSAASNLLLFRASDNKTHVCVRFDSADELTAFYAYYEANLANASTSTDAAAPPPAAGTNGRLQRRQKQLIGCGGVSSSSSRRHSTNFEFVKSRLDDSSCISKPIDARHLISIKCHEQHDYYTFANLLLDAGADVNDAAAKSDTNSSSSSSKSTALVRPRSSLKTSKSTHSIASR